MLVFVAVFNTVGRHCKLLVMWELFYRLYTVCVRQT